MFTSSLRAPQVEFQRGICKDLAPILASCQLKRVVIVHGTLRTRVQSVIEQIRQTIDVVAQIEVHDEPSLPALERHLQGFQGLAVDGLIAQTTAISAIGALDIHILDPLRRYPPSALTAFVAMLPGSEPWSGSVRPKQPIISAVANFGRYFVFCSSVPKLFIGCITKDD